MSRRTCQPHHCTCSTCPEQPSIRHSQPFWYIGSTLTFFVLKRPQQMYNVFKRGCVKLKQLCRHVALLFQPFLAISPIVAVSNTINFAQISDLTLREYEQKVGAVWKHTGGSRRIPYLAAVDTTHTRPVPAAHTPIAELYRAGWAIPTAGKLPGGKRLGASPASWSVARSESI